MAEYSSIGVAYPLELAIVLYHTTGKIHEEFKNYDIAKELYLGSLIGLSKLTTTHMAMVRSDVENSIRYVLLVCLSVISDDSPLEDWWHTPSHCWSSTECVRSYSNCARVRLSTATLIARYYCSPSISSTSGRRSPSEGTLNFENACSVDTYRFL